MTHPVILDTVTNVRMVAAGWAHSVALQVLSYVIHNRLVRYIRQCRREKKRAQKWEEERTGQMKMKKLAVFCSSWGELRLNF